jgi:hypothetical protein
MDCLYHLLLLTAQLPAMLTALIRRQKKIRDHNFTNNRLLQSSRKQKTLSSHVPSPAQHGDDVCTLLRAPTPANRDIFHISGSAFQLLFSRDHSSSGDHGRSNVVESDAALAHFLSQVLRHALDARLEVLLVPSENRKLVMQRLGLTLRCAVMTSIDTGAPSSDRADVYHSPPSLVLHVRHRQLGDDEGAAEVDVDGVIPLQNVAYSLPVPSIGYENIGVLAMGFFDLVE